MKYTGPKQSLKVKDRAKVILDSEERRRKIVEKQIKKFRLKIEDSDDTETMCQKLVDFCKDKDRNKKKMVPVCGRR